MSSPFEGLVLDGRYRLEVQDALGGIGARWSATDLQTGVPVQVQLLPGGQSEEATGDIVESVRALAKVEASAVSLPIDAFTDHGKSWIIYRSASGTSLAKLVEQNGPLAIEDVERIAGGVLEGLVQVHKAGIIHRDIKPSNILITPDGPLIVDFGVAVGTEGDAISASVIGTPGYVAPESIAGGASSPAVDLYGLGATLFYAVQGTAPFSDFESPMSRLYAAAVEPSPIPDRAGRLRPLIDGLLRRDPTTRLTAAQARALLERLRFERQDLAEDSALRQGRPQPVRPYSSIRLLLAWMDGVGSVFRLAGYTARAGRAVREPAWARIERLLSEKYEVLGSSSQASGRQERQP